MLTRGMVVYWGVLLALGLARTAFSVYPEHQLVYFGAVGAAYLYPEGFRVAWWIFTFLFLYPASYFMNWGPLLVVLVCSVYPPVYQRFLMLLTWAFWLVEVETELVAFSGSASSFPL